jgi:hypothetical protein
VFSRCLSYSAPTPFQISTTREFAAAHALRVYDGSLEPVHGHNWRVRVTHILRNYIYLHAIDKGDPLSVGKQDMGLLDTFANDEDSDLWDAAEEDNENGSGSDPTKQIG